MKIALIIPYFGTFPQWIDLFFYSVMKNQELDFIIFTDIEINDKYSSIPNVIIKKMEWNEYCDIVSKRLNIEYHPKKAYKICDLRPFFGSLHNDVLCDYAYWGFCDLDLVFGNISEYVKSKISYGYEIISVHGNKVSGHFCLFKNIEKYRKKPFQIKHWQIKLCGERNIAMDEIEFTRVLLPEHYFLDKAIYFLLKLFHYDLELLDKNERTFSIMMKCHKVLFKIIKRPNYSFQEMFTTHCAIPNNVWKSKNPEEYWVYRNGKINAIPSMRELIYLHFLFLKKTPFLENDYSWDEISFYKIPSCHSLAFFDNKNIIINRIGIKIQD